MSPWDVILRSNVRPAATLQRADGRATKRAGPRPGLPPRTSSGRMPVPSARSCASAARTCAKHHAPASTFWPHSARLAPSSTASNGPCCCSPSCARARTAASALVNPDPIPYNIPVARQARAARAARSKGQTRRRHRSVGPRLRGRLCASKHAPHPSRDAPPGAGRDLEGPEVLAPLLLQREPLDAARERGPLVIVEVDALQARARARWHIPCVQRPRLMQPLPPGARATYAGLNRHAPCQSAGHMPARTAAAGRSVGFQVPVYAGGPTPPAPAAPR